MYPIALIKIRISKAKLSIILSRSFGLCRMLTVGESWEYLWRLIVTAAIKNKIKIDNDQNIGEYASGNLSGEISGCYILSKVIYERVLSTGWVRLGLLVRPVRPWTSRAFWPEGYAGKTPNSGHELVIYVLWSIHIWRQMFSGH